MPIYEYQCVECKHRFELKQGFDADPVEPCPECSAVSRRLFHPPAVIYKGTGFYTTDYARRDRGNDDSGSGTRMEDSMPAGDTVPEKDAKSSDTSDSKE